MNKILVTDTLFVLPQHERMLEDAGFSIERLEKVAATESELVEAVKGKVGYILGGTEKVTEAVIDAATDLKVISFTGTDFPNFIPSWRYATEKGIAITNVPDGHTNAVAEWAISAALAMNRGMFDSRAETFPGIESQNIGIIGLGRIGARIAEMSKVFAPRAIRYASLHRHPLHEATLGLEYGSVQDVLASSDILFLCVPGTVKEHFFGKRAIDSMKQDALLVNVTVPGVVDPGPLFEALSQERLRAISDYPMDDRFSGLPAHRWHCSGQSQAFNTYAGIMQTSETATRSLISMLTTRNDAHWVNKRLDSD